MNRVSPPTLAASRPTASSGGLQQSPLRRVLANSGSPKELRELRGKRVIAGESQAPFNLRSSKTAAEDKY